MLRALIVATSLLICTASARNSDPATAPTTQASTTGAEPTAAQFALKIENLIDVEDLDLRRFTVLTQGSHRVTFEVGDAKMGQPSRREADTWSPWERVEMIMMLRLSRQPGAERGSFIATLIRTLKFGRQQGSTMDSELNPPATGSLSGFVVITAKSGLYNYGVRHPLGTINGQALAVVVK
jgi:hypothetical protein